MRSISICLSDLPKDKITEAKNGKKYISLIVWDKDEPDQYDKDVSVTVSLTKEEREGGAKSQYVGNGKKIGGNTTTQAPTNANHSDVDDLPF